MATINASNLELQIAQKLATAETAFDTLVYAKALEQIGAGIVHTVPAFNNLPPANTTLGELYFVESDRTLYFSTANGQWISLVSGSGSTLWTWGSNLYGQLGDGTQTGRSSPVTTAGGGTTWAIVSSGGCHIAAVKTDGTLWTWGPGAAGRLGDGTTNGRSSPGTTEGGGTTWASVSSGVIHTSAVKTDGTLWTWGSNGTGQLGDGTRTDRSSPVTTAGGGNTWAQVSSVVNHTAAVKTDGTLWTWGLNSQGRLGSGTTADRSSPGTTAGGGTDWASVASGACHTAAVKTDGTLWTWGSNSFGQLGDGNTTGRSSPVTTAGGGTDWASVSSGCVHTAAVKTDGTLWTWGGNCNGILGDGTVTSRSSPGTTAGGGTTWAQVSSGDVHTAAVKTDGTLWTWGCNGNSELGTGTITSRTSPGTTAGGGTTWASVSSGGAQTAAIQTITY